MINLLLPTGARAVRRDYRRRIWTVAGMLMLSFILVMFVVIGSLYWFTRVRLADAKQALTVSKQTLVQGDLDRSLVEIKTTNERLKRLTSPVDNQSPLPSTLLAELIKHRGQITLQKIEYSADVPTKVRLAGQAPTRSEFLKYLETLRQLPFVERFDSPVKNLVQEKNLSFTFELTLK